MKAQTRKVEKDEYFLQCKRKGLVVRMQEKEGKNENVSLCGRELE